MIIEAGQCAIVTCSVASLVDGTDGERVAYLSSKMFQGRDEFIRDFGKNPSEISIPIIGIPAWRDLVEQHRVGPWQGVREFLGMKVAYNTEYDEHRPVLIVRATERTKL